MSQNNNIFQQYQYKNSPSRQQYRKGNKCGGGEESRTPVQQSFHINFSECSLLFVFPCFVSLTNKQNKQVASNYPLFLKQEIVLFPTNLTHIINRRPFIICVTALRQLMLIRYF